MNCKHGHEQSILGDQWMHYDGGWRRCDAPSEAPADPRSDTRPLADLIHEAESLAHEASLTWSLDSSWRGRIEHTLTQLVAALRAARSQDLTEEMCERVGAWIKRNYGGAYDGPDEARYWRDAGREVLTAAGAAARPQENDRHTPVFCPVCGTMGCQLPDHDSVAFLRELADGHESDDGDYYAEQYGLDADERAALRKAADEIVALRTRGAPQEPTP